MASKIAHLTEQERQRYLTKINTIGCDPYLLPPELFTLVRHAKNLPALSFADIYIYLVENPSPYSGQSLKAFKSTEAYRYFKTGWVNDPKVYHLEMKNMFLITGRVNHSQSLSVSPTHPWITVQEDGTVLMAHCTCMAGLGEVCSHAAALMYAVLAAVKIKDGQTCTQRACAWAQPSTHCVRGVPYAEISDIDFHHELQKVRNALSVPDFTPSEEECKTFFEMLHQSEALESKPKKSAILSVIEGHSQRYTPLMTRLDFPSPLSALYSSSRLKMDLPPLLVESAMVFDDLIVTQNQVCVEPLDWPSFGDGDTVVSFLAGLHSAIKHCLVVEEVTREQAKSRIWFEQRAGRVTASTFYEAARADKPVSLIKRICYPQSSQASSEATRWGEVNEAAARRDFTEMMAGHHEDFLVEVSGLIINPKLPWIGASPDGMVTCSCHGNGVLEIKCPFNSKNCFLVDSCKDTSFCLKLEEDGTMALKTHHKYMYQVQTQMHVAEVSYCDFVVWTPQEIFHQRIQYDPVFFNDSYLKVAEFIKTRVLPELLGKWYTAPRHTLTAGTTATEQPQEAGCYCGKPGDSEDAVFCTSGQCRQKQFHKSCLRLTRVPKTWKCMECRQQSKET